MTEPTEYPSTTEEWQDAVDAAETLIALEEARRYGLVTGGPTVHVERCRWILAEGKKRGVKPGADSIERTLPVLMGVRRSGDKS